jgi:hypothetical protein
VERDWRKFVLEQEEKDLQDLIDQEKLKPEETRKFVANSFRDGAIKTTGTDIDKILPPVSRFGGGGRAQKKQTVIDKLKSFFEKYFGLGINPFDKVEVVNDDTVGFDTVTAKESSSSYKLTEGYGLGYAAEKPGEYE